MFEELATLSRDAESVLESRLRSLLDGAQSELAADFCPNPERVPGDLRGCVGAAG